MRRKSLRLPLCCLMMATLLGCIDSKTPDLYSVLFSQPPLLYQQGVYADGALIGAVVSTEAGVGNAVKIAISIQDEFKSMMTTHTVFYVSKGRLNRSTVDSFGGDLAYDTPILGFGSKLSMTLFKMKTLLTRSSAVAGRQAKFLSGQMGSASF